MKTLTLNVTNGNDYLLLLQLAKRLGFDIPEPEENTGTSKSQYHRLKKLLDSVKDKELFKEIKNPVQWQKKLRNEWR